MRRAVRRHGWWRLALAMALALTAGVAGARAEGADPLADLEVTKDGVGWNGIRIGMSLIQAERRLGGTLALEGHEKARCGKFAAGAEREGVNLSVGFPAAKPSAKIETMFVQFQGDQIVARAAELVASLHQRIPTARYLPDASFPDRAEAEDPSPRYEVPGDSPVILHLRPHDGLVIARAECLQ